jgi:hypothetical protein
MYIKLEGDVKKMELTRVMDFDEFDISILESSEDIPYDDEIELSKEVPSRLNQKLSISYYEFKSELIRGIVECIYNGPSLIKLTSLMLPKIPILNVNLILENADDYDYSGLSGSPLYSNNEIFGIVSLYDINDKYIKIIPTYCILQALEMSQSHKPFRNIFIDTNICEFSDDDISKTGHIITNDNNINYDLYKLTKRKKEHKFKSGDMIYEIDGNEFTPDGNIKCKDLNMNIPYDTYIFLQTKDNIEIKYYRDSGSGYQKKITEIVPNKIDKILSIDMTQSKNHIIYNGLIFVELSEELLKYYNNTGIDFVGTCQEKYDKCYTGLTEKIIVLVDVEYGIVSKQTSEVYKQLGLPLVNCEGSKYYLPILSKYNNKKIKNILALEEMIKESPRTTKNESNIHLTMSDKRKYKINFDATNNAFIL